MLPHALGPQRNLCTFIEEQMGRGRGIMDGRGCALPAQVLEGSLQFLALLDPNSLVLRTTSTTAVDAAITHPCTRHLVERVDATLQLACVQALDVATLTLGQLLATGAAHV